MTVSVWNVSDHTSMPLCHSVISTSILDAKHTLTLQTGYDSVAALQMGKLIKDDLDCRSKLMFLLSCFNFCNTKLKKFDFRYPILCTFHKMLQIPSINYLMMLVSQSFIINEQTLYL